MVYQCLQSQMFFGKHLFIVLQIEGSNILTLFPVTALENVQFASICNYP